MLAVLNSHENMRVRTVDSGRPASPGTKSPLWGKVSFPRHQITVVGQGQLPQAPNHRCGARSASPGTKSPLWGKVSFPRHQTTVVGQGQLPQAPNHRCGARPWSQTYIQNLSVKAVQLDSERSVEHCISYFTETVPLRMLNDSLTSLDNDKIYIFLLLDLSAAFFATDYGIALLPQA